MKRFIAVQVGVFADGKGTPSFQIFHQPHPPSGSWAIVTDVGLLRGRNNYPRHEREALRVAKAMNREATNRKEAKS